MADGPTITFEKRGEYGYMVRANGVRMGDVYKVHNRAQDDGRLLQGQSWAWAALLNPGTGDDTKDPNGHNAGLGTRLEAAEQMIRFLNRREGF